MMNISDYQGIWVFAEQRHGELQKVSLEILGESDVIPLKETGSFNLEVLKKIRRKLLWKK